MSTVYGILGIQDRDATVDSVGQQAVYEAINELAALQQAEMDAAYALFVEGTTTNYTERYYAPGGGKMQETQTTSRPGAVKPVGSWDVAYPIKNLTDQVAWDDVALAYMSGRQLDAVMEGIMTRHRNSMRYEILRRLLKSTTDTFIDRIHGSLTIQPLANGDSTNFPPVIGTDSEATENHYIETGYAASSISDTNNPFATVQDEMFEHSGSGRLVAFINNAQRAKVAALTDFVARPRMNVVPGDNTATLNEAGLPFVPGEIIGTADDVLISVWRWVPANYMITIDADLPAPLKAREDVPASLRGFKLVATQQEHPIQESYWRHRIGFGVGNRLNGVVYEFGTGGSYTNPTAYA